MTKKIIVLLSLCLLAWHCHAKPQQDSYFIELENVLRLAEGEVNEFPPTKHETDHFFPFEKGTNNSSPFNKGIDFLPPEFKKEERRETSDILAPDVAFVFSTNMENPSLLIASWQIADNYYLYRAQFQFALKGGGVLGEPQFPQGKIIDDIKYGQVEVYEQTLDIKLPIVDAQGLETLRLETTYQGCAADRLCYPPMKKTVLLELQEELQDTTFPVAAREPADKNEDNLQANQSDNDWFNPSAPPRDKEENIEANQSDSDWFNPSEPAMDEAAISNLDNKPVGRKVEFLKAEKAFEFSAEFSDPSYIIARWKIAEDYYLYRDKLQFSLESDGELGTPQLPPSILKHDPKFGDVQIYKQPQLEVIIPIKTVGLNTINFKVKYQGCAFAGYCYPPTTQVVNLTLSSNKGGDIPEQDRLANLLANANVLYSLMVFFGLGLLLSLTPCVFPMIPILSSLIVGQGKQVTTYKAFIMSAVYVLGMAFTYAIVGALTGLLGENLQAAFQNPWILVSFALIFVVLSLSMFGFYELQLPSRLQTKVINVSNRQQSGTLIGVAIMGVLSALIVGPCVAAPLVGVLIYIGQTGDAVLGALTLFTMSLGMGVPLIIVGTSAGHFLPKKGDWMDTVKSVFGVMLLAVAIWMLGRVLPGQVTMLLWASLLIISAVYMGTLDKLDADTSGWYKLWKGLGFILLVYGVLLIIGAASGNMNPLQPLQNIGKNSHSTKTRSDEAIVALQFKPIKGVEGFERELAAAKAQNKPVMLDFYADWCVSCKEMELFTLSDPQVQKLLANFVLLQADVTPNDKQDKALYKRFSIFGPPAILFFDINGQEQKAYRVVGFVGAEEFRQHLKKVIQP
jgi:thiol:disulfide interchange protein DsbD